MTYDLCAFASSSLFLLTLPADLDLLSANIGEGYKAVEPRHEGTTNLKMANKKRFGWQKNDRITRPN
jgi:hypothetical protein